MATIDPGINSPNGVRFSNPQVTPSTIQSQQFSSWEFPVPRTPFWDDIPYPTARNVLQNFTSPSDLKSLPDAEASSALSKSEKLEILLNALKQHLAAAEDASLKDYEGKSLYETDYLAWEKLHLAIFSLELELNHLEEAEPIIRMLYEKRRDKSNLSHLHNLAGLLLSRGKFNEAEVAEKQVLVWLDGKLGRNSPQSLGGRRCIVRALRGQGEDRRGEAEVFMQEMNNIIEEMGNGRFAVYQNEERTFFEEIRKEMP